MSKQLEGHFIAVVGRLGSLLDPEPFDITTDFGKLPASVVVSGWRHSSAETAVPPVGDATVELIGGELVATGTLWSETPGGAETIALLNRLGPKTRFSVAYRTLGVRPPNGEERARGVQRVLTKVRLLELSPVLVPAEPDTHLVSLKGTKAEVEAALRERRELEALHQKALDFRTRAANLEAQELFRKFQQRRRVA